MRTTLFVACVLSMVLAGLNHPAAADWPQFRGPAGDGCASAEDLPTSWGGLFEPVAWQTDIPGRGWSSPLIVGSRVWLTSAEQTALDEQLLTDKLERNPYGIEPFQAHASVDLLAIELDLETGKTLRKILLRTVNDPAPIHATNSYASPTPVTDGQNLYCHFGSFGTLALSLENGEILWQRQFNLDDITGPGSSPVLAGDLLILACDGVDAQFVVGLNKQTGEEVWRRERPPIETDDAKHRRAFCTPLLIEHEGQQQLVAPCAQWTVAYNPATGDERWRVDHGPGGHAIVPRPVFRDGIVYVTTGYMKPQLWAIRVDGRGDVTESHVLWKYQRQVPTIASPVLDESAIYFVSEIGIVSCLDRHTGSLLWQERLEGSFAASPLLADGKLYFASREGTTYVLRPGPKYEELARNRLRGQTFASFAAADRMLLIRTDPTLYCIRSEP